MNQELIEIVSLQFKRGLKERLTAVLHGANRPQDGEPIWEKDTNQIKIGDGIHDYIDLNYIAAEDSKAKFNIIDPLVGDCLFYDYETHSWANRPLTDEECLSLTERGLTLKGFTSATPGQVLTKIGEHDLGWTTPVSTTELNQLVSNARSSAQIAGNYSVSAGNYAVQASGFALNAEAEALRAEKINGKTLELINKKFWWGSLAEYNALTEIEEGTFYFIEQ